MSGAKLVQTGVQVAERFLILAIAKCVEPVTNGGIPDINLRVESYARDKFSTRKWRRDLLRGMKRLGIDRKWRKNFFKLDSVVVRPEVQLKQEVEKWPKIFVVELGLKIEIVSR